MNAEYTAKEIASLAGVDGKRMRSFIRRHADAGTLPVARCGQGNRYAFTKAEAEAILHAFAGRAVKAPGVQRTLDTMPAADVRSVLQGLNAFAGIA